MSYESPVEVIYKDVQTKLEDNIFKAIQNVQINVDRKELIKALAYDRDQYRKGKEEELKKEQFVYKWLDEVLGAPCDYEYNGKGNGERLAESGWCERKCDEDLCTAGCWDKLFELLMEEEQK